MAALDDLLPATKNIVIALNNATQSYLNVQGTTVAAGIATATVVKSSAGRVCVVSVIVGGAVGAIYDATTASSTANPIYVIPNVIGVYIVNIPTLFGIVVAPGSGQTATVSYS